MSMRFIFTKHMKVKTGAFLLALLLQAQCASLHAQEFRKLLMPGPLIDGHAELENQCESCHASFAKSAQNSLCADCHEEVSDDLDTQSGFHGLNDAHACTGCHTDHDGRAADIIQLDRQTFDHSKTDFLLEGSHIGLTCVACHDKSEKFRDTGSQCIDCHQEDDPHNGNLGRQCADCHSPNNWNKTAFDHGDTEFPLLGAHAETSCSACHINEKYEGTVQQCSSCHGLDDIHEGRNGSQCNDCHGTENWSSTSFDHGLETQFSLLGAHSALSCQSCHRAELGDKSPGKQCNDCHSTDDIHRGQNGKECSSCHNNIDWQQSTFDHSASTKFPLRGKHIELVCSTCHRGSVDETLNTNCHSCHAGDDAHAGEQGKRCERCHNDESWTASVVFDHDLSHFPLIGMHSVLSCESCHLSTEFKKAEPNCNSCHAKDDHHKQALGTDCQSCHTPNGWAIWQFDHDLQTEFSLTGAHQQLECGACHTEADSHSTLANSSNCASCHRVDDIHNGGFGKNCERCHSTDSFSDKSHMNQR